jgi:hypothetical protein
VGRATVTATAFAVETVRLPGPEPVSARLHWLEGARVGPQLLVTVKPVAEIVRPAAVTEARLRSVRLGKSSLETLRLGVELSVLITARSAPVPEHWLLVPHVSAVGATSRTMLGRVLLGVAAMGRSKRCVVSDSTSVVREELTALLIGTPPKRSVRSKVDCDVRCRRKLSPVS